MEWVANSVEYVSSVGGWYVLYFLMMFVVAGVCFVFCFGLMKNSVMKFIWWFKVIFDGEDIIMLMKMV